MVAGRLKENVVRVTRRSDRIMAISVVIDGETVNVISAKAPQVGLSDVDKKRFWDALDELVRECPTDERLFIGGDLNGHIEAIADGYAGVHEGEACSSRHKLVIVDVLFEKHRHRREATGRPRVLWKNLKGEAVESFRATVSEKLSAFEEDMSAGNAYQMWNTLVGIIRDAAKESLGVASESARTHSTQRKSWWFTKEVQTIVATNQARFKDLLSCRDDNQEDIDMAKERDIGNVRYIKDERGRFIVREEDIKKRWGEYFSSLFNESSSIESRPNRNEEVESSGPQCWKMRSNKAVGPYQFRIEAWRCLEDEGVKWLTCLFNKIFLSAKMPDEWRLSEVIPIYKNKGDAQACSNYRGIKLLSHTLKLWDRVIEIRLRRKTRVSENQFAFMSGRSTTESIHLLKSLMKKYMKRKRDLHMAFLDLEKAYDSVPRELILGEGSVGTQKGARVRVSPSI
nr:hypothetical protein [Tanacetum cinerariifolium]